MCDPGIWNDCSSQAKARGPKPERPEPREDHPWGQMPSVGTAKGVSTTLPTAVATVGNSVIPECHRPGDFLTQVILLLLSVRTALI